MQCGETGSMIRKVVVLVIVIATQHGRRVSRSRDSGFFDQQEV
jgi:hypothetical protein